MKSIAALLLFILSNFLTNAQEEKQTTTITVTVPNLTSNEGEVFFGLYNNDTFTQSTPIQSQKSGITNGKATITFIDVLPGTYAITCFHDKNGNQQMDFEPNGMPKENYGVSNNPMSYGSPEWNDAKFEVDSENITLEIKM